MAYTPEYVSADLGPIAIDGIGTVGVTLVAFATLAGLFIVWKLATGQKIVY